MVVLRVQWVNDPNLDGPGGTQVPESVIAAMAGYLRSGNVNLGGRHGPSADTWEVLSGANVLRLRTFSTPRPTRSCSVRT